MKKTLFSALFCVIGAAASHTAAAYTFFSEIAFCPQSDTVVGHCQLDLTSLDLFNFIGGITDECYIRRGSNIVANQKFYDGHAGLPRGEMIDSSTAAHLFPTVQPLVSNREYCARFEDIALWRFALNGNGYVIKSSVLGYEQVQSSFESCGTHEEGQ